MRKRSCLSIILVLALALLAPMRAVLAQPDTASLVKITLIAEGANPRDIEQQAIQDGMIEFRRSSLLKVAQGVTSIEEVLRAVPTEYLGLD